MRSCQATTHGWRSVSYAQAYELELTESGRKVSPKESPFSPTPGSWFTTMVGDDLVDMLVDFMSG